MGTSTVTSACRTRGDAAEISVTFTPPEGAWKAGLLVYESGDNYTVALLTSSGGFSINQRVNNGWTVLASGTAPVREGSYCMKAVREGATVTFTADDTELAKLELKGGKLGPCLENCTLRFANIEWK
jgi:hypothetical protein